MSCDHFELPTQDSVRKACEHFDADEETTLIEPALTDLFAKYPSNKAEQEKATTAPGIDDSEHEAEQPAPATAATEGTKAKGKWVGNGHLFSVARGIPANKSFSGRRHTARSFSLLSRILRVRALSCEFA